MRVSLVGTVHAECGLASSVELLVILERLEPDAIFAETPLADVDSYIDGSRGILESIAVGRYLERHDVDIVPVDLAKPDKAFFDDAEEMFGKVERTSPAYRRMIDRNSADTSAGGFRYLNSEQCIQSWADIYREVLETIAYIGDPRLRRIYDRWTLTNESRDRGMIEAVESYVPRNADSRGVFLVGAAHRKSLIEKAIVGVRAGIRRTDWQVGDFLENTP